MRFIGFWVLIVPDEVTMVMHGEFNCDIKAMVQHHLLKQHNQLISY